MTLKLWKDWLVKMGTSESKNEKDWLEKWEELTQINGRSGSKNEKDWLWKVGRTDLWKWEGLSQKMRRTDLEKWEGLTQKMWRSDSENEKDWPGEGLTRKNRKVWLRKVGKTDRKFEKDWIEKWEGLALNLDGLSQNRRVRFKNPTGLTQKTKVLLTPHSHGTNLFHHSVQLAISEELLVLVALLFNCDRFTITLRRLTWEGIKLRFVISSKIFSFYLDRFI